MRKFVDEVAERLCAQAKEDASGAKSLAHILVVVRTAQSGRRLRFKLAERLGAFVPPEIRLPPQLVVPTDASVAGRTDEIVAVREALGERGTLEVAA